MTGNARVSPRIYLRFVGTVFRHALVMMLRRKGLLLAAALALSPVIVPLALAFLSSVAFAEDGSRVFVRLVEYVYFGAIAPLLALFFGCMIIGEDVESETIPYLLTRPLPRSAIVLGRFGAYLVVSSAILILSIGMAFAACTSLGNLGFSAGTFGLLAHYEAVAVMALLGYGTLALFLGSVMRHPVIVGILVIFGWQRLALYIPGLIDFFTIEKYVDALFPTLPTQRESIVFQAALIEFEKQQLLISASKAAVTLLAISAAFLILTCLVVRWREYSSARAIGG